MAFDISVKVQVKLDIDDRKDINLEYYGNGASYEEIRKVSEKFVKDYIVFHGLHNVRSTGFVYGDKEGLIVSTIDDILNKL